MLNKIKLLLGIELSNHDKDELLSLLIDQTIEQIVTYTHNSECIPFVSSVIIEMVIWAYNRIGAEGLTAEAYSGVNYSYATEYPPVLMAQLNAYRKVRFL